jgi:hypothetical protein
MILIRFLLKYVQEIQHYLNFGYSDIKIQSKDSPVLR